MPFGPYQDFADCHGDQMRKGHSDESANRICGAMQAQMGGSDSNYVSHELDKNGHLILKYFFADTSMTELPTAHGHFSLDGAAMNQADSEVFGLPFSVLPSKDLSVFGDHHPWHPDLGNATLQQHIEFARSYSPGSIVGITPMGANTDVTQNGGRFVFVDITDDRAKNAYIANPALIPKKVSPGFLNMEAPNRQGIKSIKWAHLAAVPQGAYGDKARLYGSCIGPQDKCMTKLQGASGKPYCPVGASESILHTSLSNSGSNSVNNMSVNPTLDSNSNVNNNSQSQTAPTTQPVQTSTAPEQKKVLRLKGAVQTPQTPANQPQTPQEAQQPEQPKPVDTSKLDEVERRIQEIEAREQLQTRLGQIRQLIDMRLFVTGNKYNAKEHEAAINEAAQSNWTDEQIARYYGGLLKIKEFDDAQKQRGNAGYNPLGGSYSQYITPSTVPEVQGASSSQEVDLETFRAQKVKGLLNMFGVSQ